MSGEDKPDASDQPQPQKAFNLDDLIPAKVAVPTSRGIVYVREPTVGEMSTWAAISDPAVLGRKATASLAGSIEEKNNDEGLSDADFAGLSDDDVNALTVAIVKFNQWNEPDVGTGFKGLGRSIKAAIESEHQKLRERHESLTQSLARNYGFLEGTALDDLTQKMAGISALRGPSWSEKTVLAAMGDPRSILERMGGSTAVNSILGAKSSFGALDELQRLKDASGMTALEKAARYADPLGTAMKGLAPGSSRASTADLLYARPSRIEAPEFRMPSVPRPEDSTLGRATVESAENTRAALLRMEALVSMVSGLNQLLVERILPEWKSQIQDSQNGAERAFSQAGASLKWTIAAVFISIFLTVTVTVWQIRVSKEIDDGNTQQMKQLQEVMQAQLAAQQKLIEQQAAEGAVLRQAISSLQTPHPTEGSRPKEKR